ncbi:MAG: hypothetical protein D6772_08475 [Bacteroidetes bacterium]|nr:MAG: hypothetical protein D6772_08475 [Bacteroidota bacterium]
MMQPFNKDLPFQTKDAYRGFAEVHGILHVDRDELVLEFQVQDSFIGALKSATKHLPISYLDLVKLSYVRTWFKSYLELKLRSVSVMSKFPGAKDGLITLKIKRRYKVEAEDIETYVNLRIAEMRLEQLEE